MIKFFKKKEDTEPEQGIKPFSLWNKVYNFLFTQFLSQRQLSLLKQSYKKGYNHASADNEMKYRDEIKILIDQYEVKLNSMLESWFIDPEKVFTVTKTGIIMLNGQQITTMELNNLKAEVRAFKSMQIYEIVQHTVRQKAIEKAILTSTDLYTQKGNEQVLAGKMMIWDLDIIKTIIKRIDEAKVK